MFLKVILLFFFFIALYYSIYDPVYQPWRPTDFIQFKITMYALVNSFRFILKVIYQTLYSMNNFVTNKSKLPQDGAQVFPYMG